MTHQTGTPMNGNLAKVLLAGYRIIIPLMLTFVLGWLAVMESRIYDLSTHSATRDDVSQLSIKIDRLKDQLILRPQPR